MEEVRSKDGTTIAFDRRGDGPAGIVVGGALCSRALIRPTAEKLLGGGQADAGWDGLGMSDARLAVLPATTHYDIFSSRARVSRRTVSRGARV